MVEWFTKRKDVKYSMSKYFKKITAILFLLIVVLCFLVGCSNSNKNIVSEINATWVNSREEYDADSFMKSFDDYSSFTIDNIEETEKNCFVVKCSVTSPDILERLKSYQKEITEIQSEYVMNKEIIEIITNSELKTTQQNVTVFKTDNGYKVEFSEGFVDAMYGYSYIYCRNEMNNMIGNIFK